MSWQRLLAFAGRAEQHAYRTAAFLRQHADDQPAAAAVLNRAARHLERQAEHIVQATFRLARSSDAPAHSLLDLAGDLRAHAALVARHAPNAAHFIDDLADAICVVSDSATCITYLEDRG